MEVIVRNLPDQITENQVDRFFRPYLKVFGINNYRCQKLRTAGCATLTFLDPSKGRQFLASHGQTIPGANGFAKVPKGLHCHSRPVNCSQSNKILDPHLLQSLQKEERDRYVAQQSKKPNIVEPTKAEVTLRAFEILNLACGQWDYADSDLVFHTHFWESRRGRLLFTDRFVFIKLSPMFDDRPSHQLVIPYTSIHSFTTGAYADPTLTFLLKEAPKLFEVVDETDTLANALDKLGLDSKKQQSFKRRRIAALSKAHEIVVSSCLAYRFTLSDQTKMNAVQKLRRLSEIPQSMYWPTSTTGFIVPFAAQMTKLNTALSRDTYAGVRLPFELKFQLQKLAQNGYLTPSKVVDFLTVVKQHFISSGAPTVVKSVQRMFNDIPFPGPATEAQQLSLGALNELLAENIKTVTREQLYELDLAEQYDHIASIHKATVTPTGVYLYGPIPEVKNRVLRKYSQFTSHFLSVSFLDEDGEPLRYDRQTSNDEIFNVRFKKSLERYINVAGRPYEFLGFSHSSLRSQTCWFMAPFTLDGDIKYALSVIKDLGDFSMIRSPAKCAARIGQAFSQTFSAIHVPEEAISLVPDVKRNNRIFSDGCGTCSPAILHRIWDGDPQARGRKPTVLQIRFQGAKGMISLDTRLTGDALRLRPSMIKFEAPGATDIEICGAGLKPLPMYLNRQLIKILEDMGVSDSAFLNLQADTVERLRMTTLSAINASTFMKHNFIGKEAKLPWLVRKLWDLGLSFSDNHFLRDTLELAVLIQLREIKHRSRVRIEQGCTLYGIMDETGFLQEGQIYCSVHAEEANNVLTGMVVITRCPALHPGDVQIVEAVDVPSWCALRDVHNVVVFSSMGERDLPSQLSGGDLDGDLFNVIYDNDFFPTRVAQAADYPIVEPIDIGRPVDRRDMTDFFVKFMANDQLGHISTVHQTLADQKQDGTMDPACITLAGMASTAVDFSKTGIPVDLSNMPKYSRFRPDFQAPGPRVVIEKRIAMTETDSQSAPTENDELDEVESYSSPKMRYYESKKILGKLYREIDEIEFFQQLQKPLQNSFAGGTDILEDVWEYVAEKTMIMEWKHCIDLANDIRESYEENLADTMLSYSLHPPHFVSEIEVFTGSILGKNGAQSHRQRESSKSMKDKHDRDTAYTVQWIMHGDGEDGSGGQGLERSIACLWVGKRMVKPRKKVGVLHSFAWVAASVCLQQVEKLFGH